MLKCSSMLTCTFILCSADCVILPLFDIIQTIVTIMYDNQNVPSSYNYCMFLHHIVVITMLIHLVWYCRLIKLTYHRQHVN